MRFFLTAVIIISSLQASAAVDVENSQSQAFSISGYLDARFVQFGEYNAVPSRAFSIRRAGIETEAEITDNLKAEIKIEMSPDNIFLKDALVEWDFLDLARGRFGQFRRATLLGGELSTWDLPLMDRPLVYDLREDLTYCGRDLGVDIEASLPAVSGIELSGILGVFNGDKRAEERTDSELLYSFRGVADIVPAGITLGCSAVSHRLGEQNPIEPDGYTSSARLYAFSGDVSIEHAFSNWYDASLQGEYSAGDNWEYSDVLAGDDPPSFSGLWGSLTASYHPWNVHSIRTISLTVGYDQLKENTDLDMLHRKISVIGSVYPVENFRLRFGGVRNTIDGLFIDDEYTDLLLEASLRF